MLKAGSSRLYSRVKSKTNVLKSFPSRHSSEHFRGCRNYETCKLAVTFNKDININNICTYERCLTGVFSLSNGALSRFSHIHPLNVQQKSTFSLSYVHLLRINILLHLIIEYPQVYYSYCIKQCFYSQMCGYYLLMRVFKMFYWHVLYSVYWL